MVGELKTIVWDAPDIQALADFYVGAAGLTQHYGDDEWVTLYSPDGWRFGVQRALDHVPPQWPDPAHPQQMHVDFQVADIEAAAQHAESLGARRLSGNDHWITLADPAGHPFDFCQAEVEGTKVFAVTIDTDDAAALGRFYSALLGLDLTYEGPEGVLIGTEGQQVMFQQVAELRRPRWPTPPTRSSCTSTSPWPPTRTRPSGPRSPWALHGYRVKARTGGCTPTRTATRSACSPASAEPSS